MKNILICLTLLFSTTFLIGQKAPYSETRFIEVTGSAELEVEPDEIIFVIGIKEYWKEELDKNTEFKDYKTKVPLAVIEKLLLADLAQIGIQKEDLVVREVGNYWRYHGKDFLISKQLEIKLSDLKKVNEITQEIKTQGIDYMRIGELKSKEITEYRKQVKIEALRAAQLKAAYLLESIDENLGQVVSITEIENDNVPWSSRAMTSNTMMSASDNSGIENIRKIKLRYEIKVKFEIK